jgi:hypothetical protein
MVYRDCRLEGLRTAERGWGKLEIKDEAGETRLGAVFKCKCHDLPAKWIHEEEPVFRTVCDGTEVMMC